MLVRGFSLHHFQKPAEQLVLDDELAVWEMWKKQLVFESSRMIEDKTVPASACKALSNQQA